MKLSHYPPPPVTPQDLDPDLAEEFSRFTGMKIREATNIRREETGIAWEDAAPPHRPWHFRYTPDSLGRTGIQQGELPGVPPVANAPIYQADGMPRPVVGRPWTAAELLRASAKFGPPPTPQGGPMVWVTEAVEPSERAQRAARLLVAVAGRAGSVDAAASHDPVGAACLTVIGESGLLADGEVDVLAVWRGTPPGYEGGVR